MVLAKASGAHRAGYAILQQAKVPRGCAVPGGRGLQSPPPQARNAHRSMALSSTVTRPCSICACRRTFRKAGLPDHERRYRPNWMHGSSVTIKPDFNGAGALIKHRCKPLKTAWVLVKAQSLAAPAASDINRQMNCSILSVRRFWLSHLGGSQRFLCVSLCKAESPAPKMRKPNLIRLGT